MFVYFLLGIVVFKLLVIDILGILERGFWVNMGVLYIIMYYNVYYIYGVYCLLYIIII